MNKNFYNRNKSRYIIKTGRKVPGRAKLAQEHGRECLFIYTATLKVWMLSWNAQMQKEGTCRNLLLNSSSLKLSMEKSALRYVVWFRAPEVPPVSRFSLPSMLFAIIECGLRESGSGVWQTVRPCAVRGAAHSTRGTAPFGNMSALQFGTEEYISDGLRYIRPGGLPFALPSNSPRLPSRGAPVGSSMLFTGWWGTKPGMCPFPFWKGVISMNPFCSLGERSTN